MRWLKKWDGWSDEMVDDEMVDDEMIKFKKIRRNYLLFIYDKIG